MSTTQESTNPVSEPSDERIRRLAVEAGKYLGREAGDRISVEEVRRQAEANGYDPDQLLPPATGEIRIPEQGDLLGELWAVGSPTDNVGRTAENPLDGRPTTRGESCGPEPLDDSAEDCYRLYEPIADSAEAVADPRYLGDHGDPLTAFEAVGTYIERRHGENVSAGKHGFHRTRQWTAKKQYATGKEMDRQLVAEEYDNPTTVLLSLRLSPGDRGRLTLLTGSEGAIDAVVEQLRYRLQEAPDAPLSSEEWEYFAVVAGTCERATPHLHVLVYCDGDVPRETFYPVARKWVEKCPYAPEEGSHNSPESGAIRLRGNGDDEIPRMDDAPTETQAGTYVLTQLPHLAPVDEMARDELLHSSTLDAWGGQAFRKSQYSVWDDGDGPSTEEVSGVRPTLSANDDDILDLTDRETVGVTRI